MMSKATRFLSCLLIGCMAMSAVSFGADAVEESMITVSGGESQAKEISSVSMPMEAINIMPTSATISETVTPTSDDWECTVLNADSYKQVMIDEMGMTSEEAEQKTQQLFSKWGLNSNGRASNYQTVKFSRYKHPGSYTRYEVRFGFTAIMTSGSTPLFVSVDSVWANATKSGNYEFDPGSLTAYKKSSTAVQMDCDGYIVVPVQNGVAVGTSISTSSLINAGFSYSHTSSSTMYYRYYASCYEEVHPTWMS